MFFDIDPMALAPDATFYFNVCVINIAVRESLGGEYDEVWDLTHVTSSRPLAYHIFKDKDKTFRKQEQVDVEIFHHCVIEVCNGQVSFFTTDSSEMLMDDDEDEDDMDLMELDDPNDLWRF